MSSICWQHTPAHYTTATLPLYWAVAHTNATVDSNDGYGSTPALTASANGAYVRQQVFDIGNPNDVEMFARVKVSSEPTVESILFGITDANLDLIACITRLQSGQVAAYRGAMVDLLAVTSDADVDDTGVQHRLGFVASLRSSGFFEIRLDDAVLASASGVDLTGGWAGVYLGCHQNIFISHAHAVDDLNPRADWLCDVPFSAHANLDDADNDRDATTYPLAQDERLAQPLGTVTSRRVVYGFSWQTSVKALDQPRGFAPAIVIAGQPFMGSRRPIGTADYQAVDAGFIINPQTNLPFTTTEIDDDVDLGGDAVV